MSVLRKRGPLERDSETQRTLRNGPQNFPWHGDGLLTAPPFVTQYPRGLRIKSAISHLDCNTIGGAARRTKSALLSAGFRELFHNTGILKKQVLRDWIQSILGTVSCTRAQETSLGVSQKSSGHRLIHEALWPSVPLERTIFMGGHKGPLPQQMCDS